MGTTSLTAGQVMDRSAALLNDPAKTDYTYVAQLPYLNMAIDEMVENFEESNSSPSNLTLRITVLKGVTAIYPPVGSGGLPTDPHLPDDFIEIQELGERTNGSNDSFVRMTRCEFLPTLPPSNTLMYWTWELQKIQFNRLGALSDREVELKYIRASTQPATDENTIIAVINARSFLSFKTAALCAMFIGENPTRAETLEDQATKALERMIGINNKGRQNMTTRRRPFRHAYKTSGGF